MTTKLADSKGRVALGPAFANKLVIVENVDDTEVRIIAATVIPERELWLHQNSKALAAVQKGLSQARAGRIVKVPSDLGLAKKKTRKKHRST